MKYLVLFLSLLSVACHQKNHSAGLPATGGSDSVKKAFFPVRDFLNGEIGYVDSTPLAIRLYIRENNKTDSSFITPLAFHQMALQFLVADLDSSVFNREYKENVFLDETTKTVSFTYSTDNQGLALKRVDVLAVPSEEGSNKVSSIYLETREQANDTLVTKKMYWQSKKQFQVVTMSRPKGQETRERTLKAVWEQ